MADNMAQVVATCDNLHKTYLLGAEGVAALRGIELDVRAGEFLVVYGASGGGKSTLLNVLGTVDTPTKGNLSILGERITDQTPDSTLAAVRCQRIGFVFQSFNLLSTLSALDNVMLPMLIRGALTPAQARKRAAALLAEVGLSSRASHFPSMLSGGEQQRVTIARALANDPEVLLLDEPTGDLDTRNTLLVLNILLRLNNTRGLTMVMVTHDVYMRQYAHRAVRMRDGKVHAVEEVPAQVRAHALQALQAFARSGRDENEPSTRQVVCAVRQPREYDTFAAHRDVDLDEDAEMTRVVDVLFGAQA